MMVIVLAVMFSVTACGGHSPVKTEPNKSATVEKTDSLIEAVKEWGCGIDKIPWRYVTMKGVLIKEGNYAYTTTSTCQEPPKSPIGNDIAVPSLMIIIIVDKNDNVCSYKAVFIKKRLSNGKYMVFSRVLKVEDIDNHKEIMGYHRKMKKNLDAGLICYMIFKLESQEVKK
jgi:hypothetical protein